jgi:putative ubiquitin-RnfH superfamily antitoxin RatB of RatAB toxin-antitoxin module
MINLSQEIEVVYVPEGQLPMRASVPFIQGICVSDVLQQSGFFIMKPELVDLPVGIFGRQVSLNTPVVAGDRVEIYRPLTANPMEKRRVRARKALKR